MTLPVSQADPCAVGTCSIETWKAPSRLVSRQGSKRFGSSYARLATTEVFHDLMVFTKYLFAVLTAMTEQRSLLFFPDRGDIDVVCRHETHRLITIVDLEEVE